LGAFISYYDKSEGEENIS